MHDVLMIFIEPLWCHLQLVILPKDILTFTLRVPFGLTEQIYESWSGNDSAKSSGGPSDIVPVMAMCKASEQSNNVELTNLSIASSVLAGCQSPAAK